MSLQDQSNWEKFKVRQWDSVDSESFTKQKPWKIVSPKAQGERHNASFLSWMLKADVNHITFLLTFTRFSLSSLKGSDFAQWEGFHWLQWRWVSQNSITFTPRSVLWFSNIQISSVGDSLTPFYTGISFGALLKHWNVVIWQIIHPRADIEIRILILHFPVSFGNNCNKFDVFLPI